MDRQEVPLNIRRVPGEEEEEKDEEECVCSAAAAAAPASIESRGGVEYIWRFFEYSRAYTHIHMREGEKRERE